MTRSTTVRIHAIAGVTAFTLISSFFTSSLVAELSGNAPWMIGVKKAIFYGMWAMLLFMPMTVSTGFKLAGRSQNPIIIRKRARLRWIAANGFVLMGLAFLLYRMAIQAQFGTVFLTIQVAELGLGATNMVLLGNMIRDGLRLRQKGNKKPVSL